MRSLEYPKVSRTISDWISRRVQEAGAEGIVIGLSGGIDSSTVATLALEGLVKRTRILGLIMPEDFTPEQDTRDAHDLADWLGIESEHIPIGKLVRAFPLFGVDKMAVANVRARVRMILLYMFANNTNRLVLGTGDLSEHLLGYFTKYGDGGTDLEPIGNLFKTEVRKLGKHLGIQEKILRKPSSPHLYPNHLATDQIPAEYDVLDPFLYDWHVLGQRWELNEWQKKAVSMFDKTKHKRAMPESPDVS